jgi:hypothetical protein
MTTLQAASFHHLLPDDRWCTLIHLQAAFFGK